MSDVVLIPLPGFGTLELPRDIYERHLVRPAAAASTIETPPLLDAAELETRTGIPSSWWMTQARERRVPFRKLGRYVRFNYSDVLECDAYKRRAVDSTGLPIQQGGASG